MSQVKNAADEQQVKKAAEREKSEREIEMADVKALMSSVIGRRFMNRLLSSCGLYRLSFNNSGSITAFNEGERNVGLKFLADVTEYPDLYLLMLQENRKVERK